MLTTDIFKSINDDELPDLIPDVKKTLMNLCACDYVG